MLTGALAFAVSGNASADSAEEKQKLAQCAKDLCSIIVSKNPKGPDLSCDLTKTWDKDTIQKGAESKNIAWGLGSARCTAKVSAKRADIVAAFTSPEVKIRFSKQPFACELGSDKYPVSATLAPELKFKNGTTTDATLNMDDIKGAILIKGVVWTAAALEHLGIVEGDLVREVNRFVEKQCPKIVSGEK